MTPRNCFFGQMDEWTTNRLKSQARNIEKGTQPMREGSSKKFSWTYEITAFDIDVKAWQPAIFLF